MPNQWARGRLAAITVAVLLLHAGALYSIEYSGLTSSGAPSRQRPSTSIRILQDAAPPALSDERPATDAKPLPQKLEKASEPSQPAAPAVPAKPFEVSSEQIGILPAPQHYLSLDELDLSASPEFDLGLTLGKIFPAFSGIVVLELWIDEEGRVMHVQVLQGRSLNSDPLEFKPLIESPFQPAMKDGRPRASRKVIEVDTDRLFVF
jgi:hypothetical protein